MRASEFLTEAAAGKQAMDYKRSNRYPDGTAIPDSLPARYQPASFPGVPKGQNCDTCEFYNPDNKKCHKFSGDPVVRPTYWCAKWKLYVEDFDQAVEELKTALLAQKSKLQKASDDKVYDLIDTIMKRIAKEHDISGKKLHDVWVKKYKKIPDTWIMDQ